VILGLIDGDNTSYLSQDPEWTPTYGSNDTFLMTDLLTSRQVVTARAKAGVVGTLG
jgi:hypothetical protein